MPWTKVASALEGLKQLKYFKYFNKYLILTLYMVYGYIAEKGMIPLPNEVLEFSLGQYPGFPRKYKLHLVRFSTYQMKQTGNTKEFLSFS